MAAMNGQRMLLVAAVLLVGALLVIPTVSSAQESRPHHNMAMAAEAKAATTQPAAQDEANVQMMAQMQTMAEIRDALTAAKGTAGIAPAAVAKIDEALRLLEKEHRGMHEIMANHMKAEKGAMLMGKDGQAWKCPMCVKPEATAKPEVIAKPAAIAKPEVTTKPAAVR
jgi:hypothetical protein